MKKSNSEVQVHLGLQIPAGVMASLDRAAKKKRCSRSALVREYLAKALAWARV
jgi:metal-responsive CopG/Arc/MetJ family transcriptional regulator